MTSGELAVLVFALFTMLFALLLVARPWRHQHEARGNDRLAWLIIDGLVALWLLVCIFGLVFSILLITLWANPAFPDPLVQSGDYLVLIIPLVGIGWLGIWQGRRWLSRSSNTVTPQ